MEKYYWFSAKRHAHDIEFRRNRLFNEIGEMKYNDIKVPDKMYKLLEQLDELRGWLVGSCDRAVQIPARLYQLAIDSVMWANTVR